MFEKIKKLLLTFINVFVVVIGISCIGFLVFISSLLITDVANTWRLTGYLDLRFGLSVVFIYFFMVWAPIWLTALSKRK